MCPVSAAAREPRAFPSGPREAWHLAGPHLTTVCLLPSGPPGPRGPQGTVELASNKMGVGEAKLTFQRLEFPVNAFCPNERG